MKAKKALGQNWLSDALVLQQIVNLAQLDAKDNVLEIGPGLGYLTDHLLKTKVQILALEYDAELIPKLNAKYNPSPDNLQIVEGDIRKFDLAKLPSSYKVVANIPYYLTANLLRKFTDDTNKPSRAVLLVQKEVAQKLADQNRHSMLNVLVGYWYSASLGPVVPAELFEPAPKVDSQVLVLDQKPEPLLPSQQWPQFLRLAKTAFAAPRKKLRANLAAGLKIDKQQIDNQLKSLNINPDLRAEQLQPADWQALINIKA